MPGPRPRHDVVDLSLGPVGDERIRQAERRLDVLAAVAASLAVGRTLAGVRVTACIDVTPASAVLVRALASAGASVACCAADPGVTDDAVAAALVTVDGLPVFAAAGAGPERYWAHLDAAADHRPTALLDSGGALIGVLHGDRREQLANVVAGVEGTAVGALRLEALAAEGKLTVPVIATASESGVAAAVVDRAAAQAVLAALGLRAAVGATVVVLGYPRRGAAIASAVRSVGARLVVSEVDPVRALAAVLDGHRVAPLADATTGADVLVVVSLSDEALGPSVARLRVGGLIVNASDEPLAASEWAAGHVEASEDGRPVAGRRSSVRPDAVDDVCLAVQALALDHAVRHASTLPRVVSRVPAAVEAELARAVLARRGSPLS